MRSRFRQFRGGAAAIAVILGTAIGVPIIVTHSGNPCSASVAGVANVWVCSTAGASPQRCSSPCAYDSTHAYGADDAAYAAAFPGDLILVHAGSYSTQTIVNSTANGKPSTSAVTIRSAGAVVVNGNINLGQVDGSGNQNGESPDYVTFDGNNTTTVNGHYFAGYWTTTPDHETVENAVFQIPLTTSAQGAVIRTRSASNFTLSNVEVAHACCSADGIGIEVANDGQPEPSNILISRVYVHDIYDTCAEVPTYLGSCTVPANESFGSGICSVGNCNHVDGFQSFGGNGLTIDRSIFYLSGDHHQGIFMGNGNGAAYSNVTISNDFIYTKNSDTALGLPGEDNASDGASGFIKILYNTVVGVFSIFADAANGHDPAPGTPVTIAGNIFVGSAGNSTGGGCTGLIYSDGSTLTPTWRNNMTSARAGCDASDIGNTTPTFVRPNFPGVGSPCQNGSVSGCTSITGFPDLHLLGAQPAVGGGEGVYCGPGKDVTVNIDGIARTAPCTIGAA